MPQGARGTTKTVDADGNAAFEDLELGLYLIVQSKASNGYAPIKPFLVSLPMAENGKWNYEVDASPKVGGYTPVNPGYAACAAHSRAGQARHPGTAHGAHKPGYAQEPGRPG